MYEFLVANPIVAIIFLILVTVIATILFIKLMQTIGLEKIRSIVYDGFVKAENNFKHGDNIQKFEYVVQLARSHIPEPFNMFITEKVLRNVVQLWFNLCKDLLDDGKMNGTGK